VASASWSAPAVTRAGQRRSRAGENYSLEERDAGEKRGGERERDGRETKGGDGLDSGLKLSIS